MSESDPTPEITPRARRLAEDARVAWHNLSGVDGPITERDVLEHLTGVVTGNVPAQEPADEIDFSGLAASLSEALGELLAEAEGAEGQTEGQILKDLVVKPTVAAVDPVAVTDPDTEDDVSKLYGHVQAQLEAERQAHAHTQRQLDTLKASATRQKVLAAQLRPLAAEIRRLGSALGVANAEMERLRPLEAVIVSLQEQLEEARVAEARTQLLCRDLQVQRDLLEENNRRRPRWQFWRRPY